jgi:hypothetical protein
MSALTCCWPIGDPGKPGFRYCGKRTKRRRLYCPDHESAAHAHSRDRTIRTQISAPGRMAHVGRLL